MGCDHGEKGRKQRVKTAGAKMERHNKTICIFIKSMHDKKTLSERDICTKYITPALKEAGWDIETQILEEVSFTDGKIFVRGKLTARGKRKRADYILYYNANPIAIIEAKDNHHSVNAGIQQALDYAQI